MPTKPPDRLLFAQGARCFFCARPLSRGDASVEHLVAVTYGGRDNDENCVACCKQLNALLGRMSLKEKFRLVLNQEGVFVCPAANVAAAPVNAAAGPKPIPAPPLKADAKLQVVLVDLHNRGAAKPRTVEKPKNKMKSALKNGDTEEDSSALVDALQSSGAISVCEGKIAYALPPRALSVAKA